MKGKWRCANRGHGPPLVSARTCTVAVADFLLCHVGTASAITPRGMPDGAVGPAAMSLKPMTSVRKSVEAGRRPLPRAASLRGALVGSIYPTIRHDKRKSRGLLYARTVGLSGSRRSDTTDGDFLESPLYI